MSNSKPTKEPGQVAFEAYDNDSGWGWEKRGALVKSRWADVEAAVLKHHGVTAADSLPPVDPAQSGS